MRTRAEEERKEKRAAQKAAVEAFRSLLEEVAKVWCSTDIFHFWLYLLSPLLHFVGTGEFSRELKLQ